MAASSRGVKALTISRVNSVHLDQREAAFSPIAFPLTPSYYYRLLSSTGCVLLTVLIRRAPRVLHTDRELTGVRVEARAHPIGWSHAGVTGHAVQRLG